MLRPDPDVVDPDVVRCCFMTPMLFYPDVVF